MSTTSTLFTIRPWQDSDLPALLKHGNNPLIAQNMTDSFPHPYLESNGRMFIEFARSHEPYRLYAIEVEGEAAGGIGIHPQQDIQKKNAELGYWLSQQHWGKGIMAAAVRELVKKGFSDFDLNRIFARPFGNNRASQRVLEKAGFKLEAVITDGFFKNNEFVDEMIYAIRRSDL